MASEPARPVYQPIHHSVRPLLDDGYFQYVIPDDQRLWDGSARTTKRPWPSIESALAHISATQDMNLGKYEVRVFTPEGERPIDGWPVSIWFHGRLGE